MTDRLNFLDVMRGIAVLAVLVVHTAQLVSGLDPMLDLLARYGQMGVQLFFVVSAFTICRSYSRDRTAGATLGDFYIRRFFRIAPLYYAAIPFYWWFCAVTFQISAMSYQSPEHYTLSNIVSNILFVHGFFAPGNNTIVPGGWSIGTEAAFYVVFPLLYRLMKPQASGAWPMLIALSCLLLNVMLQVGLRMSGSKFIDNNNFFYFNLINQLPVFAVGAVWFLSRGRSLAKSRAAALKWGAGFISLTLVAIVLFQVKWRLLFAVIPFVSALSFVCLGEVLRNIVGARGILSWFGRVSYSIYIWHFAVVILVMPSIDEALAFVPLPSARLVFAVITVLSIVSPIAFLSELLIERRGIRIGSGFLRRCAESRRHATKQRAT